MDRPTRDAQQYAAQMSVEEQRRQAWRGRDAQAEPFRPIDEIQEAGQRRGWTVITADDARHGDQQ